MSPGTGSRAGSRGLRRRPRPARAASATSSAVERERLDQGEQPARGRRARRTGGPRGAGARTPRTPRGCSHAAVADPRVEHGELVAVGQQAGGAVTALLVVVSLTTACARYGTAVASRRPRLLGDDGVPAALRCDVRRDRRRARHGVGFRGSAERPRGARAVARPRRGAAPRRRPRVAADRPQGGGRVLHAAVPRRAPAGARRSSRCCAGRARAGARPGLRDRRVPGARGPPDRAGDRAVARRRGRVRARRRPGPRGRRDRPLPAAGSRPRRCRGRCSTRTWWWATGLELAPDGVVRRRGRQSAVPRPAAHGARRARHRSSGVGPTPTPARCSCTGRARPGARRRHGRAGPAAVGARGPRRGTGAGGARPRRRRGVALGVGPAGASTGRRCSPARRSGSGGRAGSGRRSGARSPRRRSGSRPSTCRTDARRARRPRRLHRRLPRPVLRPGAARPRGGPTRRSRASGALVTTGLIEPAECQWGRRPTRFARQRYDAPVVDLDALRADGSLAPGPDVAAGAQGPRRHPGRGARGGGRRRRAPGCRRCRRWSCTPPPDRLWHVLAVLLAPPVVAHAAARYLGTGLSARLGQAQRQAAGGAAAAGRSGRLGPRRRAGPGGAGGESSDERVGLLLSCAEAMCAAYDGDHGESSPGG